LVKSSGFVAQIKRDPKYQQSPKIPYLISPGLILSLYILGSPSGAISYGLFHSTTGISIAYSGGF
jgi:hypothetical protein